MPRFILILVGILIISFLTFGAFASGILTRRSYSPGALPESACLILFGILLATFAAGMRRIRK
jgi:hypothetical protein